MDDNISELIGKFSNILKEKNIDLNEVTKNCSKSPESTTNSDFSIDLETILKIKTIIQKINQNDCSPRNAVLQSLKPYLESEKKEKLDKYIKIANLLTILEDQNIDIGLNSFLGNKKGYDFILIITLFLLIF